MSIAMSDFTVGKPVTLSHSGTYHTRAEISDDTLTIVQTNRNGCVDCVILPRSFAVDIAELILRSHQEGAARA